MSPVSWHSLRLDALDVASQARFWSAVSGLRLVDPTVPARLTGPSPRHTLWVDRVEQPHVAKNRVHLDVDCATVEELVGLGARVLAPAAQTGFAWSVLADPEGNEFCAFERPGHQLPDHRIHGLVVDSHDPEALARWWGDVLGTVPTTEADLAWWTLTGVAVDEQMTLDFVPVPETRVAPQRVHWTVTGQASVLVDAGATPVRDLGRRRVLADPEGNEFSVVAPG